MRRSLQETNSIQKTAFCLTCQERDTIRKVPSEKQTSEDAPALSFPPRSWLPCFPCIDLELSLRPRHKYTEHIKHCYIWNGSCPYGFSKFTKGFANGQTYEAWGSGLSANTLHSCQFLQNFEEINPWSLLHGNQWWLEGWSGQDLSTFGFLAEHHDLIGGGKSVEVDKWTCLEWDSFLR